MSNSANDRRLSWGMMCLCAALAGTVVIVHWWVVPNDPWISPVWETLLVLSMFLPFRFLLGSFWGLVAAGLVVFHPVLRQQTLPTVVIQAEFLKLAVLLCVVLAWRRGERSRTSFYSLTGLALVSGILSGWAWLTTPNAGWVSLLFVAAGWSLVALQVGAQRFAQSANRPALLNVIVAAFWAVLLPAFILAIAVVLSQTVASQSDHGHGRWQAVIARPLPPPTSVGEIFSPNYEPDLRGDFFPGIYRWELHQWGWPNCWLVLGLMALGLYRSIRGGRLRSNTGSPSSWLLLLFVMAQGISVVLHPQSVRAAGFLPLAILAVMLSTFGVGDVFRGISNKMVLSPPE